MHSKFGLAAALPATLMLLGFAMTPPSANAAPADDACALLTQAQVGSALGASVGVGEYEGTYKKVCTWIAAGSAGRITLQLEGLDSFQSGKVALVKTIVVTPVSGVGEDAYYLAVGSNVGLIVKKGSAAFKVAVYSSAPVDKKEAIEKTLASQAVSKL